MITLCPFCGDRLDRPLKDGLASCGNCMGIFDDSAYHRILSAYWSLRRHFIQDEFGLEERVGLDNEQAMFVSENSLDSPDEFLRKTRMLFRAAA